MNSPKVAAAFGEGNSASVIDMDQERHNFPWSGSYTPDGSSIAWSKASTLRMVLKAASRFLVDDIRHCR